MLIAKDNAGALVVAEHHELFPDTSFPASGPTAEFLVENGCYPVTAGLSCDHTLERREYCDPYLLGGVVYLSTIVPLTQAEKDAAHNASVQAQIKTLEDSITNRMWREDAAGSTSTIPVTATIMSPDMQPLPHPYAGMTSTEIIQYIDLEIAALRATLR